MSKGHAAELFQFAMRWQQEEDMEDWQQRGGIDDGEEDEEGEPSSSGRDEEGDSEPEADAGSVSVASAA